MDLLNVVLRNSGRLKISKRKDRSRRRPARTDKVVQTARAELLERSTDGVLSFRLTRRGAGLFVERAQVRPVAGQTLHVMIFDSEAEFERWCDADDLRFVYPQLFSGLRRSGSALLSAHE